MFSSHLTIKDLAVACNALCEEGKGDSHVVVRTSEDDVYSCTKTGVVYDRLEGYSIFNNGCLILDAYEKE